MLIASQLCGFMAGGGVPTLAFQTSAVSGSSLTTYTFSAQAIGSASADRLVVVIALAHESDGGAGDAPTSVTIGGITAAIHVSAVGVGSNECSVGICSAIVASGTTADIVLTYPDARVRAGIAVYTVTGWSSTTPAATYATTANSNVISRDMTVLANHVAIAGATMSTASNSTTTWTNATETMDAVMESSQGNATAATVPTNSGTVTVTATFSASDQCAFAGAVWA